ncbi:hypothetical protein ABBQ38_014692 [Trebouxia sp. C0009 RCD-2024]
MVVLLEMQTRKWPVLTKSQSCLRTQVLVLEVVSKNGYEQPIEVTPTLSTLTSLRI